jgi:hypothetical protein
MVRKSRSNKSHVRKLQRSRTQKRKVNRTLKKNTRRKSKYRVIKNKSLNKKVLKRKCKKTIKRQSGGDWRNWMPFKKKKAGEGLPPHERERLQRLQMNDYGDVTDEAEAMGEEPMGEEPKHNRRATNIEGSKNSLDDFFGDNVKPKCVLIHTHSNRIVCILHSLFSGNEELWEIFKGTKFFNNSVLFLMFKKLDDSGIYSLKVIVAVTGNIHGNKQKACSPNDTITNPESCSDETWQTREIKIEKIKIPDIIKNDLTGNDRLLVILTRHGKAEHNETMLGRGKGWKQDSDLVFDEIPSVEKSAVELSHILKKIYGTFDIFLKNLIKTYVSMLKRTWHTGALFNSTLIHWGNQPDGNQKLTEFHVDPSINEISNKDRKKAVNDYNINWGQIDHKCNYGTNSGIKYEVGYSRKFWDLSNLPCPLYGGVYTIELVFQAENQVLSRNNPCPRQGLPIVDSTIKQYTTKGDLVRTFTLNRDLENRIKQVDMPQGNNPRIARGFWRQGVGFL